jgi:hypothetical protein
MMQLIICFKKANHKDVDKETVSLSTDHLLIAKLDLLVSVKTIFYKIFIQYQ